MPEFKSILPADLLAFQKEGRVFMLVDVRTPAEFRSLHVEGAHSFPLDRLDPAAIIRVKEASGCPASNPVYLICQSGPRALEAARRFQKAGHGSVILVDGGTAACDAAGLAMVRGRRALPIERQVRIVAGLLVLGGVLTGHFIHGAGYVVAGVVGAGLIFAGVTDFCGMALLLARMPWNR